MESDEVKSAETSSILTKINPEKLPKDVRDKYEEFFNEYIQNKALYETLKMNSGKNRN